tara:strand:+ start:4306 stop:4533 length:228 start_codon:yes stop_codon:yes gene_type:complete
MEKDNQGALFRNEDKKSENHPDYSGTVTIGGKEMWISGWINESKSGKQYMKLSFRLKDNEPKVAAPVDLDEEVPF